MDHAPNSRKGRRYSFLGTRFYVPVNKLMRAVRQSRRLNETLVDELMKQSKLHAELITGKKKPALPLG